MSISFTEADLNMLKLRTEIATTTANSFVSFTSNTVTDFAGNDVIAVAPSSARQANSFIPDTTAPELVRYSLDMDDGFLSLTFSETVDSSTIAVSDITLLDTERVADATGSYKLTDSTATTVDGTVVNVTFSNTDFLGIQSQITVGASVASTFISTTSSLDK